MRALSHQPVDYVPCCLMSFTALRKRVNEDLYALVDAERGMGLDSMLFIPSASRAQRPEHPDLRGLPVRFGREVASREWRDGEVLHREYRTPDGTLSASVLLSDDWPHGNHIPFVDDYQVPRATKHLITEPSDLPALQHLLTAPQPEDVAEFRSEAARARSFAEARGVLLAGGWGAGMDMLNWLCGMDRLMEFTSDRPDMVAQMVEMVHAWNRRRMEVVLSAPVDLFIRRAWYEGCDFVTRRFFRSEVLPRLRAEVDLAHARGAKFGYICSSGQKPMLDSYLEAGIDVLIGLDPVQGNQTDLPLLKEKLGGRVALWGGVSGAVTVEMGGEEEIRAAVRQAVDVLGPEGFVLSPVDNITVDTPRTWSNLDVFLGEWRNVRQRPGQA